MIGKLKKIFDIPFFSLRKDLLDTCSAATLVYVRGYMSYHLDVTVCSNRWIL